MIDMYVIFSGDFALKDVELKLISELMKNSRRSDRELAKVIGVSQPTVSRMLAKLQKEGVIREFTVIPDFQKLGYSLAAITFGRVKEEFREPKMLDEARKKFVQSFNDAAFEVVLDERDMGLGYDGIIVSFHRNYPEYSDFKRWVAAMPFIDSQKLDSFLIDLNDEVHHRYLTFSYLAKHLLQTSKQKERPETRR
jgi:DNA-binding Lrp family transcriptional regulator